MSQYKSLESFKAELMKNPEFVKEYEALTNETIDKANVSVVCSFFGLFYFECPSDRWYSGLIINLFSNIKL